MLAGYYAGNMLEMLVHTPHEVTSEFRMAYLKGRTVLDQDRWGPVANRLLESHAMLGYGH